MTYTNPGSTYRFQKGDVLAGKYRVERVLGAGGMGIVLAAEHLQLRQPVAIKLLLPSVSADPDTIARFAREAQAAARIQSEHVARVIDVAALEDGSPYMVMEFLEGKDLGKVLSERGPLPLEEAVGYLLQSCEGVAEAHAAGIVHRDLKPSNLFVCQRPGGRITIKVLDFGISKAQPLASAQAPDRVVPAGGARERVRERRGHRRRLAGDLLDRPRDERGRHHGRRRHLAPREMSPRNHTSLREADTQFCGVRLERVRRPTSDWSAPAGGFSAADEEGSQHGRT
jgi:serine/threonine protein kinase